MSEELTPAQIADDEAFFAAEAKKDARRKELEAKIQPVGHVVFVPGDGGQFQRYFFPGADKFSRRLALQMIAKRKYDCFYVIETQGGHHGMPALEVRAENGVVIYCGCRSSSGEAIQSIEDFQKELGNS